MNYGATIGTFDGVHLGHRYLLQQLREVASLHNMRTLALTFSNHPSVTLGREAPPMLCSLEDKVATLSQWADEVEVLDFTDEIARLTAREFMQVLRDEYDVRFLLLGYDHRFGRPSADDDYEAIGRELGIIVKRATPFYVGDRLVSSTAIRKTLLEGDVCTANAMLGCPYILRGAVVRGHQVGRTLGFPTANISTSQLLPKPGVYVVQVAEISDETDKNSPVWAILNIGYRPTLDNGDELSVEVHIPGFEGDLYGRVLSLLICDRLRDEQKFSSLEDLRTQITKDIEQLKKYEELPPLDEDNGHHPAVSVLTVGSGSGDGGERHGA